MPDSSSSAEPVSYHVLPVALIVDLVQAYNVQHVIDLTPSCLDLAGKLVERGFSYVGVCGTQKQRDWLKARADGFILDSLKDPTSRLFDKRLGNVPVVAAPAAAPVAATPPPKDPSGAPPQKTTVKGKKATPKDGKVAAKLDGSVGGALNLDKLLAEARARAEGGGTGSAPSDAVAGAEVAGEQGTA